ncbi:MAG: hypothetical protein AAFR16_04640 [Pseudomonadota bacterium]
MTGGGRAARAAAICAMVAGAAATATPAAAERAEDRAENDRVEQLEQELEALSRDARETIERVIALAEPLLRSFASEMLESLPPYAAPEILPNGDILIRRLPRRGEAAPGETPAPKQEPEKDRVAPEIDQTDL